MTDELELYAVRNREGHWFRAKGYGGYGETWVPELKSAKLYARIGQARGRVTYFAGNFPEHGVPEVVRLVARVVDPIPGEAERATKAIAKKWQREDALLERQHKDRLERAKRDLDRAKLALKSARVRP